MFLRAAHAALATLALACTFPAQAFTYQEQVDGDLPDAGYPDFATAPTLTLSLGQNIIQGQYQIYFGHETAPPSDYDDLWLVVPEGMQISSISLTGQNLTGDTGDFSSLTFYLVDPRLNTPNAMGLLGHVTTRFDSPFSNNGPVGLPDISGALPIGPGRYALFSAGNTASGSGFRHTYSSAFANYEFRIEAATATAVPEPSGTALMLTGALVGALAARRRGAARRG